MAMATQALYSHLLLKLPPQSSAAGPRSALLVPRFHRIGTGAELVSAVWKGSSEVSAIRKRSSRAALSEDTDVGIAPKVEVEVVEEEEEEEVGPSGVYMQWDAITARAADSATLAFLLLQLPQIVLNTQNLMAGDVVALTAIPWMKERGATVVQAVGVLSTGVVLSQLALGGAMPVPIYAATASVVVLGLALNWLSYFNKLSPGLWQIWGDAVTIGGLTVLPQVMWSTFVPFIPPSVLPGSIFGASALGLVILNRLDKLPPEALKLYSGLSAWTATLLFMWCPVAQAWSNYLNPANIKGLSVLTVLLAMAGNGLLLPRALFTRDLMWFTGSSWGTLLQGWGILVTMFVFNVVNDASFYGISVALALYLGWMTLNDAKAYSLQNPFAPLVELITGSRST